MRAPAGPGGGKKDPTEGRAVAVVVRSLGSLFAFPCPATDGPDEEGGPDPGRLARLSRSPTSRPASAYLKVEPDELARTLPGIAEVGAPLLVAAIGRPQRFASAAKFKAFTGLTPKGLGDRRDHSLPGTGLGPCRHHE